MDAKSALDLSAMNGVNKPMGQMLRYFTRLNGKKGAEVQNSVCADCQHKKTFIYELSIQ